MILVAPPPVPARQQSNASNSANQQSQLVSTTSTSAATTATGTAPSNGGAVDVFGMPSFGAQEFMEFEDMRVSLPYSLVPVEIKIIETIVLFYRITKEFLTVESRA